MITQTYMDLQLYNIQYTYTTPTILFLSYKPDKTFETFLSFTELIYI
jgi:hypothetical protein